MLNVIAAVIAYGLILFGCCFVAVTLGNGIYNVITRARHKAKIKARLKRIKQGQTKGLIINTFV
jgi:hypothetical protein